ncbi:phage tail protein [Paenibacillus tritici]|uniref:phage tail protein n=1 Tax=Paenibacillus tritici TaxID=1873425 RepID=UPI001BAC76AF|nr:phage tail protein [Paenibacillus tritici]QUL57579.1 phage tail protein [Paenibacillus tritici]
MEFLETYDKNLVAVGLLVKSYDVTRKRRINSDNEISFMVPMNSKDYLEKIIKKGHIKDERGQYYVIQGASRVREDRKLTASIMCTHVMFKLTDFKFPYSSYIAEAYGVHISQLTNLISAATGGRFTFSIDDTFDLCDVKDFGQGNCLQALNKVVEMYGCEVEADNFVIHLKKQIGKDEGMQYRIQKNIISDQFKDDASSLVTRLFAQMKDGRTWIGQPASILTNEERALLETVPGAIVNGILQVNYLISSYAATWASNSVPFFDGEIIEQNIESVSDLLEAARKTLREKEIPSFEVTADSADLYKIRSNAVKPDLGDTAYCYDPDIGLNNLKARIMELTEYPFTREKHAQAVLSNVEIKDMDDIISDLDKSKKLVDNLYSNGRIRTELFEAVAKQVITDINNSKTELIYPPEGGILAREKTDHNRQVRLTSAGLGISTDGWQTVRSAVTAAGVLAETVVGQFGSFVSMLIGSGNAVTQINTNGIAAGHSNFYEAPFRVDMAGNVVANKLTANSAVINNSTFGGGAIIGSSINVGSGKFTVSTSGDLYTQGGIFSGGTITGALIRTAASGARFEVDSSGWRTYDDAGVRRIGIFSNSGQGMSAITFDRTGGGRSGAINGGDGLFAISSDVDMQITALTKSIYFQGQLDFTTAYSISGLQMSHINGLPIALSGKSDKGTSTTAVNAGAHNHGFPNGTQFKDVNGVTYTWSSYVGFTHDHIQQ